ncbi:MAG: hypothetical protein ACK2T3_02720, partial [Candidatus Promineifilaceae bacterium]
WGDGDYEEYYPISGSTSGGQGTLYGAMISPTLGAVLLNVNYTLNDNAINPQFDSYLASVGWTQHHGLKALERSDQATFALECGPNKYEWEHNLLEGNRAGPVYGWHSPIDNFKVLSGTELLASDLILESHSSSEYNVLHSSWISVNQIISNSLQNSEQWVSPDLEPFGTISSTIYPDIVAMTQVHEDYPFFMSTGDDPSDLWEWEISYEMLVDTSVCEGYGISVEVVSGHNSPDKGGGDIIIPPVPFFTPTALELENVSIADSNALLMYAVFGFVILSAVTLLVRKRKQAKRVKGE